MKNNIASDFLVNIFKKFKNESIEYVVLRNYEKLPFDNDSKDVDILIKACTIDSTINLILKEAKELGYNCIWLNPLDYLVGLVVAKVENGAIYSVKIDLFIGLKWRGIEYINSDLILSRSIPYKEFFVPSKGSEAFIMILYYTLYAKGIRDKYLNHIYCYATNNIDDFKDILTKTLDSSLSSKISNLTTQNKIKEVVFLRKDIIKKLLSKNINLSYIFNLVKHIKSEYIDRKKFGSMVNITNLNSEELNVLKECFISLGISTIVFLLSISLGEFSFLLVFGEESKNSINIFYILSPLIIILPMAYLFFNVILLSFKLDKYFSKLYIIGGITNLSMIFILFQFLEKKIIAVSLSLLITELLIMLLAYILIKNKKIVV